jgi:hypothetical protein
MAPWKTETRQRRSRCAHAALLVLELLALAPLVGGCHSRRQACDVLPQLEISKQEATAAEYMPGYPVEHIGVKVDIGALIRATMMADAEAHKIDEAIANGVLAQTLQGLRDRGEAPLVRLTGKGDGARCLKVGMTRFSAVGRMFHAPNVTRQYVQHLVIGCERGRASFVGRRYERTTEERSWAKLDQCLRESGFDGMSRGAELNSLVTDGTSYFLEAVREGRYHAVLIHHPNPHPDGTPTAEDCCRLLLNDSTPAESGDRWPPWETDLTW